MKNNVIYIVGATVLVGGAYLFLKNKKAKDLAELDKLGGETSGGTTSGGTSSGGITPNLTEPVKITKDLNLDSYNIQKILEELKDLENQLKAEPKKTTNTGVTTSEWYGWYFRVGKPSKYNELRQVLLEKLAKLGYKFDNGLLVKI
jgi:hypothetical protein